MQSPLEEGEDEKIREKASRLEYTTRDAGKRRAKRKVSYKEGEKRKKRDYIDEVLLAI